MFGNYSTSRFTNTTGQKPVEKVLENSKKGQNKKVFLALVKINHLAKDFESQSPNMEDFTNPSGWKDRDGFFNALDNFKQEQHQKFYSIKNKVIDLALKAGHLQYLGKHEHLGGFSDSVGSKFAKSFEDGEIIGEFHANYQNPVSKKDLGFLQNDGSKAKIYNSNLTEKQAREILANYIATQKKKTGKKFLKNKAIFKKSNF